MLLFNFVGMSNSINVIQICSILFTAAQTRKTVNIGREDVSTNILNRYHLLSYSTLTRQKTKPLPLLKVIGREENSAPRGPTGGGAYTQHGAYTYQLSSNSQCSL